MSSMEQQIDTWIEVQFAQPSGDPTMQSGNRQAMEKLLIDAQRESGQSSLAQSGSVSPAVAGARSPPIPATAATGAEVSEVVNKGAEIDYCSREQQLQPIVPAGSVNLPTSEDWQRDWQPDVEHFRSHQQQHQRQQQPGWQQCESWRFLSLRKTALMRWPSSLLLGLLSHAASFLLGAASMYIMIRSFGSHRQQRTVGVISHF